MRSIDLMLNDLKQILGDKKILLFMVAMPVVFTIFMGLAYRSGGETGEDEDTRIPLALVDPQPDGQLNMLLTSRLQASDALKPVSLDEEAAREALRKGDVAGVLLIPADFSVQAEAGKAPQLTLLAESASTQGQSLYQLVRLPVSQLLSAVEIARISAETAGKAEEYGPALELAWSKWEQNSRLSRVRTEQAVTQDSSGDWTGGNPYNQSSPGILVQFAIMGLVTSAQILVQERKTRTLQRLMTTSLHPWEIIAGHLLAMFTLTFMQTALLVLFAQLALGVNYLLQPLGTLLVSVGLGLWVAAMGLLIGVLAKGEEQVILFSLVAMFLFSALGGAWFPLEGSGKAFAALGGLMPSAWAMTGYQNIIIRGQGLESAWLPAGILLLYALGFFGLAVWRFKRVEM